MLSRGQLATSGPWTYFRLLPGFHSSLIRHLLVFFRPFFLFRCSPVQEDASLRTVENPAILSCLGLFSQSVSSYGGSAARTAVPGGPLAAPPAGFRPGAGTAALSPGLDGIGGGVGLSPRLGRAAIGRLAAAPTSVAVRALPRGGSGGAHPHGGLRHGRADPRLPQVQRQDGCREGVGGVMTAPGVGARLGGGGAVGVAAAGGNGAALSSAAAVPSPAAAASPAGEAWILVGHGGRRHGRGPGGGGAAPAGGPAGVAGVPPAVPSAGGRPPPLVAAAPAHRIPLAPVERAARAAALLTRERPRAGALVALETVYVSAVTRATPGECLRALLADLTCVQVHASVDVRRFGSVTA